MIPIAVVPVVNGPAPGMLDTILSTTSIVLNIGLLITVILYVISDFSKSLMKINIVIFLLQVLSMLGVYLNDKPSFKALLNLIVSVDIFVITLLIIAIILVLVIGKRR